MKTQDEWDRRTHLMDVRVQEACRAAGHRKVLVDYSAYGHEDDDEDLPLDNLGEVAVQGKCVLFREKGYYSPVLESPTWLEATVHANAMIYATRDCHHVFFEGLDRMGEYEGVPAYRFLMGS